MLDPHEIVAARSQGWQLVQVYDLKTGKARPQVLPITFAPPLSRASDAMNFVTGRARNNDALALKALRCVMQGLKT